MEFSKLANILHGRTLQDSELSFQSVATDSRLIQNPKETIFFARKGPNHDGHAFVKVLYEQGVRLFVLEASVDDPLEDAGIYLVEDALTALQTLARDHRDSFHYPVIGITGSNGKTTVKEWLASLLQDFFKIVKSPKSYNSQLGVPLSIMKMQAHHELAIMEAGVSHSGEMDMLAKIIMPNLGIFTNIGPAHNEGFESLHQKVEEKARLFASSDHIICRRDHELVWSTLSSLYGERVRSWSLDHPQADIQYRLSGKKLTMPGTDQSFDLHFTSEPQLENLLHCLTMGLELGIDPDLLNESLLKIRDIDMRLTLKSGINNCYIVDDTYNNDLVGLEVALDTLNQQKQKTKKTVVLSDILQSGLAPKSLYTRVNELLEQHHIQRLIGIGKEISANAGLFSMENSFFLNVEEFKSQLPSFGDEIILVKGARPFKLEKVVQALEEQHHGTHLTMRFESVLHNLNSYRELLGRTKLMVMVKAYGYGGGSYELANFLQYHQVDYLGVAYVNEGIDLRKNGVKTPIMVMNPDWESLPLFEQYDLEPEIYSPEMLDHLISLGVSVPIHLKVETGMNRLGFRSGELDQALEMITQYEIRVRSVFSHLAGAEDPVHDEYTTQQVSNFERAYQTISSKLDVPPLKHIVNSGGIVRWPQYHFDMVRLGIGLHGIDPTGQLNLRPVSTFKTKVSQVKSIKKGETIGYSRAGLAKQDMTIATLPVGYADGYRRSFGCGKAFVIINGQKARTIGNICMDMSMVDVTGLQVTKGEEVILFGQEPSIHELAKWADTIPYEILTSVSGRVKRVYSWD